MTLVTDSRIHTPTIMALHVTREGVKNIQCNYRVSLLFFLSISPFPQPLHSSIPLHILMLRVKAPVALAHQLDSLLIGSLQQVVSEPLIFRLQPCHQRQGLKILRSWKIPLKCQQGAISMTCTSFNTAGNLRTITITTRYQGDSR